MKTKRETEELAREYYDDGMYYEAYIKYVELYLMKGINTDDVNSLFKPDELQAVKAELTEAFSKLKRIISHGNEWDEDEWLLILTIRVEIQLVLEFFSKPQELSEINEIDQFIRNSKDNKDYMHARNLILRNWKSIDKEWLAPLLP